MSVVPKQTRARKKNYFFEFRYLLLVYFRSTNIKCSMCFVALLHPKIAKEKPTMSFCIAYLMMAVEVEKHDETES